MRPGRSSLFGWLKRERSIEWRIKGSGLKVRKTMAASQRVWPDNQGNAYVFLEVEFRGAGGMTKVGRVTTLGHVSEIDARVGAEVAVFHSPTDDRRFAVYTPGIAMIAGVVAPR